MTLVPAGLQPLNEAELGSLLGQGQPYQPSYHSPNTTERPTEPMQGPLVTRETALLGLIHCLSYKVTYPKSGHVTDLLTGEEN